MEEDERQDVAARKLQTAYRARQARLALKKLIRENYVKLYDRINDQYVYKNKNTKEIFLQKPIFLGNDDLPTPKIFAAPNDYDPKVWSSLQFLIVFLLQSYSHTLFLFRTTLKVMGTHLLLPLLRLQTEESKNFHLR